MGLAEGWPRRISFGQIAERHGISISDVFRFVEYIDADVVMPAIGWEDMSGTGCEDLNKSRHWTIAKKDLFRLIYGDEQEITLRGENRNGRPISVRHLRADVPEADVDISHYKDICELIAAEKKHEGGVHPLPSGGAMDAAAQVIHAASAELKRGGYCSSGCKRNHGAIAGWTPSCWYRN